MTSRRSALLLLLATAAWGQQPKYSLVDGHLHFLNFVQETDGMAKFLKAMDDTGVAESVVIGMPVVKQWDEGDAKRPTYYLDNDSRTYWYSATDFLVARAILDLPKDQQARLHPFICGINSADRNAVDHVRAHAGALSEFLAGHRRSFSAARRTHRAHLRRDAARHLGRVQPSAGPGRGKQSAGAGA
jgi:hypothetical protein